MIKSIVFAAIAITIMGGFMMVPVWFMWNHVMPELFNLPKIDLSQAFSLFSLWNLFVYFPVKETHLTKVQDELEDVEETDEEKEF